MVVKMDGDNIVNFHYCGNGCLPNGYVVNERFRYPFDINDLVAVLNGHIKDLISSKRYRLRLKELI